MIFKDNSINLTKAEWTAIFVMLKVAQPSFTFKGFVNLQVHVSVANSDQTLLYLIRRSYGYIYYLMVSSEPVSEALLPVYNQLQTLKRCLIEVKNSGGVNSPRELYPYSMKVYVHFQVDAAVANDSSSILSTI